MKFKKILFGISALALFSACTEDFKDWAEPQSNNGVPAKTVDWTVTAAQSEAIVLDNVEGDVVKLINVSLPDGVSSESFNVKLTAEGANYPDYNITADGDGNVSVADLQRATTEMFNIEAVERTFDAVVSTDVNVEGTEGNAAIRMISSPLVVKVVPKTPQFNPFIFFIGATDGWVNAEQRLALEGEGVYKGFLYIADPNGWGVEFKFQQIAGNWDSQLNSGSFTGGISGDFADGGDNIKATAGEGVYYVVLDVMNSTLQGTFVHTMGLIGDFNGWGGDVEMTWNPTDYCYEATNPGVTANGWKFRMNNDWAVNLGGDLNNLTQDGANITAVGSTIKLYPTRKTSDKIYCTVE